MKINVNYIESSFERVLIPCIYHMADGSVNYYYQYAGRSEKFIKDGE